MEKISKNLALRESCPRSIVKALIYRIFSILGTGFLTWLVTKNIKEAISITTVIQIFLVVLYFTHERVWNKIDWGKEIK